MTKFPFKNGDHLLCEKGGALLREGGVYVAHSVTQPHGTLEQWVYVDVLSGGREWMPASDFLAPAAERRETMMLTKSELIDDLADVLADAAEIDATWNRFASEVVERLERLGVAFKIDPDAAPKCRRWVWNGRGFVREKDGE